MIDTIDLIEMAINAFDVPEETKKIMRDYFNELIDDSVKLNSLINGGVDNWEWYDEALEEYRNWKEE